MDQLFNTYEILKCVKEHDGHMYKKEWEKNRFLHLKWRSIKKNKFPCSIIQFYHHYCCSIASPQIENFQFTIFNYVPTQIYD